MHVHTFLTTTQFGERKSERTMTMAPYLNDYHQRSTRLRALLLRNEEERLQIEQKLRSISTIDLRLQQSRTLDQIQDYFARLNEESRRAEERNRRLLNDFTRAQSLLDQIQIDAEKLIRLKRDFLDQPQPQPYDFDRSRMKSQGEIEAAEEYSTSESTTLSRSKRPSSLRMELTRTGLYFLFNYLEKEFLESIDKKKFYQHDPPTLTQKKLILNIANGQQQQALKEQDPATVSMVILDQLPSTIRRTTVKQCLLTEEILSGNIVDMTVQSISRRIPEQDRILWDQCMRHLMKLHHDRILSSELIAQKFASALLPEQTAFLQDKAKSLLKHLVEHQPGQESSTSDDESSKRKDASLKLKSSNSSWLNKALTRKSFDDESSSSSTSDIPRKTPIQSTITTPRKAPSVHDDDGSDLDFYS